MSNTRSQPTQLRTTNYQLKSMLMIIKHPVGRDYDGKGKDQDF